MADSATTRVRLRKQSLGSNVNTWGDTKLNEALDVIDQVVAGYAAIAMTGDTTPSTTNYSTSDDTKNRILKLTGSLTSAANLVLPSVESWYIIINATGQTITVKTASGSGVAVDNTQTALVYCDASNFVNAAPQIIGGALEVAGKITGLTTGTASGEAVEFDAMEAAIAAGGGSGAADGTVKMDVSATSVYLNSAVLDGDGITKTDNGNSMTLAADGTVKMDAAATHQYLNAAVLAGNGISKTDNGNTMSILSTGQVKMDASATHQYLNAAILVGSGMTKVDNGNTMTLSSDPGDNFFSKANTYYLATL
tara:strand:+ start:80 stop:1006 length:927 start_codon:yes stop_codon:yes gene_type:complete